MACTFGNLGSSLADLINEVLLVANNQTNTYDIDFSLYSPYITNTVEMSLLSVQLFSMEVIEDYVDEITDIITCKLTMNPKQFGFITDNIINLRCKIRIYSIFKDTEKRDELVYELDRKVYIRNQRKIDREVTATQIEDLANTGDGVMDMEIELIDDLVYKLRKFEFQFIAHEVTMKELIKLIAYEMGVKQIHLVDPDNGKTYEQIIIPHMEDLASIFDYLQNEIGLGIYIQGCCYYLKDKVLYVYPQNDTESEQGWVTHVINVGNMSMPGLESYHKLSKGKDRLDILAEGKIQEDNRVTRGIENRRGGRVICMSQRVNRDWCKTVGVGDDAEVKIADKHYEIIEKTTPSVAMTAQEEASASHVVWSENNPYSITTRISDSFLNRMAFVWLHAVPNIFKPSFPAKYHYERLADWIVKDKTAKVVVESDAAIEKVIYNINPREGKGFKTTYTCAAVIQMLIESEPPTNKPHYETSAPPCAGNARRSLVTK